jgi:hypothetical protein
MSRLVRRDQRRSSKLAGLCAILLFSAPITKAEGAGKYDHLECAYGLKNAPSGTPKFSDFPVRIEQITKSAAIDFRGNPTAHLYRTVLRAAAESGPNFAGHYMIADLGCGSSCSYAAMIDERTGKVYFDQRMEDLSGVRVDDDRLQFQVNSSLLIVLGGPHEDEEHGGIFYYRWTGEAFKLLRFVSGNSICKQRQ